MRAKHTAPKCGTQFEKLGIAKRDLIVAGVERLRETYEKFIHEQQDAGVDFTFIDGQMIGNNFYKLILHHIADEIVAQHSSDPDTAAEADPSTDQVRAAAVGELLRIAIDTLRRTPLNNESDPDLM